MDPRLLCSNSNLTLGILSLIRHLQDEQTKIIDRQENQEAELRTLQDQQIKLLERQMQQDEYLKILQDGQAEILARQQSHYEEIMQVLLSQNQLISTGRQSSHFILHC